MYHFFFLTVNSSVNKKYKYIVLLLSLSVMWIAVVPVFAQQQEQYSLYMFNKYEFNSAYSGLERFMVVKGGVRGQWIGLQGAPVIQKLNAHLPLEFLHGGIGLNLKNDILGAARNTTAMFTYAYHHRLGHGSTLSFGVGGGFLQRSLDGTLVRTSDGVYAGGVIEHHDSHLPASRETAKAAIFTAGLYYFKENFEFGAAVVYPTNNNIVYLSSEYSLERSYFINFAATFDLTRSISILPSMLVKTNLEVTQTDFSVLLKVNDNIFMGGSFRGYHAESVDAVAIIMGYEINTKFSLFYAYDISLSTLKNISRGSHEFMLTYNINKPIGNGKLPPVIYNPRHL